MALTLGMITFDTTDPGPSQNGGRSRRRARSSRRTTAGSTSSPFRILRTSWRSRRSATPPRGRTASTSTWRPTTSTARWAGSVPRARRRSRSTRWAISGGSRSPIPTATSSASRVPTRDSGSCMIDPMPSTTWADAQGLCTFVDASPSPFHVCATVSHVADRHGFTELHETDSWPGEPGRYFLVRGGSLIAWSTDGLRPDGTVPHRRRAHRQPEPAGQAAPRPGVGGVAAGGSRTVRRRVAQLVARPRPRASPGGSSVRDGNAVEREAGPRRRADPARAAAGDPPVRGPQGRPARSAAPPQRGVGRGSERRSFIDFVADRGGGARRRGARLGTDDARSRAERARRNRTGPRQRAATRQPGHLLRGHCRRCWRRPRAR